MTDDFTRRLAMNGRRLKVVPRETDAYYRQGLLKAAATVSPKIVRQIETALRIGPDRGGFPECQRVFGTDFVQRLLPPTAPIVDMLEVAMPGFKTWLAYTGFADCKWMVKAFLAWAEVRHTFEGAAEVLPAVRH